MLNIEEIRVACNGNKILITKHMAMRFQDRGIYIADIKNCIMTGEIIRQYEDDKPFPSCLLLGLDIGKKRLHVVVSLNEGFVHVITAYYPDPEIWDADFKTKKEEQK